MRIRPSPLLITAAVCCLSLPVLAREAIVEKDGQFVSVPFEQYIERRAKVYREARGLWRNHSRQSALRAQTPLSIRVRREQSRDDSKDD